MMVESLWRSGGVKKGPVLYWIIQKTKKQHVNRPSICYMLTYKTICTICVAESKEYLPPWKKISHNFYTYNSSLHHVHSHMPLQVAALTKYYVTKSHLCGVAPWLAVLIWWARLHALAKLFTTNTTEVRSLSQIHSVQVILSPSCLVQIAILVAKLRISPLRVRSTPVMTLLSVTAVLINFILHSCILGDFSKKRFFHTCYTRERFVLHELILCDGEDSCCS